MAKSCETRVPCSKETRERLWNQKRGGESFDRLFRKMIEQYDPDAAYDGPGSEEEAKIPA